jgi:hypothetical protein
MQAGSRLNARGFDGLNLNKAWHQRRKRRRRRGPAHSADLPHGVLRSCVGSMNLLVAKCEVLVDDALRRQLIQVLTFGFRWEVCLVAGQEL